MIDGSHTVVVLLLLLFNLGYCILASNMFKWYPFVQIMIGPLGFFLPDNIISVSSNTACKRAGKVQVVFDEFKLSRSPH